MVRTVSTCAAAGAKFHKIYAKVSLTERSGPPNNRRAKQLDRLSHDGSKMPVNGYGERFGRFSALGKATRQLGG